MPAVSSRSLPPHGMPCSGPRYFPAAISDVGLLGLRQREIARQRDDAAQLGIEALQSDRDKYCVSRSEVSWRVSIQRESCVTGANAMSSSRCGQRPGIGLAADESIALRHRLSCPAAPGSQRDAGESVASSATLCAARFAARRAPPWSCANCRPLARARRRSSPPAPTFPLRRKCRAKPTGPTGGAVPNAEGVPGGGFKAC